MSSRPKKPFFSCTRERWLWTLTAVVVLTIYLTLGLTPRLVGYFSDDQLAAMFLTCMVLVGITILTQGLRIRPSGREIGIGIGVLLVYLMLCLRMAIAERSHLIEYSVVAVLIFEALTERSKSIRRVSLPAIGAIVGTSVIGTLDECIQWILPGRHFDLEDIVFNILAAIVAVTGMVVLRWVRRPVKNEPA